MVDDEMKAVAALVFTAVNVIALAFFKGAMFGILWFLCTGIAVFGAFCLACVVTLLYEIAWDKELRARLLCPFIVAALIGTSVIGWTGMKIHKDAAGKCVLCIKAPWTSWKETEECKSVSEKYQKCIEAEKSSHSYVRDAKETFR